MPSPAAPPDVLGVWRYIVLSIVAFGLISLFNAEALASGSRLARSFCLYVALFGVARPCKPCLTSRCI